MKSIVAAAEEKPMSAKLSGLVQKCINGTIDVIKGIDSLGHIWEETKQQGAKEGISIKRLRRLISKGLEKRGYDKGRRWRFFHREQEKDRHRKDYEKSLLKQTSDASVGNGSKHEDQDDTDDVIYQFNPDTFTLKDLHLYDKAYLRNALEYYYKIALIHGGVEEKK